MNVFELFKRGDNESIKLAIEVVKTLNYSKEFSEYFKIDLWIYEDVFKSVYSDIDYDTSNYFAHRLFVWGFETTKLASNHISWILKKYPQLINVFDLHKLDSWNILHLLKVQPQFIDKVKLDKMEEEDVELLLKHQPHLKPYFGK